MLRLRLHLEPVLDRLGRLSGSLAPSVQVLRTVQTVVARAIERNFEEEGRPVPWAPLRPPYALYKASRYPGRKILERTRRLRDSIRVDVERGLFSIDVVASTDVFYAPFHQFGIPAFNLPARPFLVLTGDDLREAAVAYARGAQEL